MSEDKIHENKMTWNKIFEIFLPMFLFIFKKKK